IGMPLGAWGCQGVSRPRLGPSLKMAMIVFLWPFLSSSEKLPEAYITCLSGERAMARTAPVPQVDDPWAQLFPPLPIRPGPVDCGPWKPWSTKPVRASRAASLERAHTQRLLDSRVESLWAGVPQVLS